ncbi:MAG: hypothetical protein JWQ20_3329 [Conexibacter sp.]|jgi:hypothetical protein|nr:hypothetical protein [Conexibacter sp.]
MHHRAVMLIMLVGFALAALLPAAAGATTHLIVGNSLVYGDPVPDALTYQADDTAPKARTITLLAPRRRH